MKTTTTAQVDQTPARRAVCGWTIRTRYIPATNYTGARIAAESRVGRTVISYPYGERDAHEYAARQHAAEHAEHMNAEGLLIAGGPPTRKDSSRDNYFTWVPLVELPPTH